MLDQVIGTEAKALGVIRNQDHGTFSLHGSLLFVPREDFIDLIWVDVAVQILIDQYHRTHTAKPETGGRDQCPLFVGRGLTVLESQRFAERIPNGFASNDMTRRVLTKFDDVAPSLFRGEHVVKTGKSK